MTALYINNDKIVDIKKSSEAIIPNGVEVIDANGNYVGPGFVDIHVHRGNGFSSYFDAVETSNYFLMHGTTTMLATPEYALNYDKMISAIKAVKDNIDKTRLWFSYALCVD